MYIVHIIIHVYMYSICTCTCLYIHMLHGICYILASACSTKFHVLVVVTFYSCYFIHDSLHVYSINLSGGDLLCTHVVS